MTSYQPGDRVHVAQFGKGIVREVRNNGRYLVEVKGRAMEVSGTQLSPLDSTRASRPSLPESARPDSPAVPSDGRVVTLDLHGYTVEDALDALDRCLSDALLSGASEVRVIHGKSGGRIKAAVHRRLKELTSVRNVRLDPHNEGVTIVSL